jgi:LEA14-like dessication related protein
MVSCARPTGFDYLGVRNIKLLKAGFKESTVSVEVGYYNPNKYPVTMKRAEADVYVNNALFGHTVVDTTIQVPRKDTFYLPVLLTVNMTTSVLGLLQTFSSGQDTVLIKMDGSARVGRGGIFINYPIKYEGKQVLKF